MASDDYENVRQLWATLPPQRIRLDFDPDQVLALVRHDYGLSPDSSRPGSPPFGEAGLPGRGDPI